MLKLTRRIVALIFLLGLTWLFLDFTGTAQPMLGWMAKLQLLPSILALNWVVVVALLVITWLFGRIYCSVICPLGILQDAISWIAGKLNLNKNKRKFGRFSYDDTKWHQLARIVVFALFVVSLLAGFGFFVQLLAPYSSFGRMVTMLLKPLYEMGNNALAAKAEEVGSFQYYTIDIWQRSLPLTILAGCTFLIVAIMAWVGGRAYCNNICPVGTLLGFLSRRSLFRVQIDADKCKNCGLCARKCKGAAIDFKNHTVDGSRCVDCFDCLDTCNHGALTYSIAKKNSTPNSSHQTPNSADGKEPSRRAFLTATAAVLGATAIKAQEKTTDGGFATILDKQVPERKNSICPPGAISLKHLQQHCTGCQLCVSECPNGVLRPSSDLLHMMVPEVSYERGYCRPECTRCSDVCPAGAIIKFKGDAEERQAVKASTKIGTAHWIKDNCVVLSDGVSCGACARRCPQNAIQMVPSDAEDPKSAKIPVVDEEKCIGCGACENLCPSRPFSAIYVEGADTQREI